MNCVGSTPPAELSSDSSSTTTASVNRIVPAIDAAFCNAVRVTLVGSIIPAT